MDKANVLLIDLETAPSLGYVWGKYQQDVITFHRDWYILCFAYKWLGQRRTHVVKLPDFKKTYANDPEDDSMLLKNMHGLINKADVIIAHNGDKFDLRKANARFISIGLKPPHPYQTVDTLKAARKHFKFDSNRLDDLGRYLGVGRKVRTGGFDLWLDCMKGCSGAWRRMAMYNRQDVNLLERVYYKIRPWMTNHPNIALLDGKERACPKCSSTNLQRRGYRFTKVAKVPRFRCKDCGAWSSAGKSERITDIR